MDASQGHAEPHFLEVLEARSKVFRIIYDTVIETEGASETETYHILCRNLRRICEADYCALAAYVPSTGTINLRAIDERNSDSTIPVEEIAVPSTEIKGVFTKSLVQACSDLQRPSCLAGLFPAVSDPGENKQYLYAASVREGCLLALGVIAIEPGRRLKMKDLIEVYLNMMGMIIQRINALNDLTSLNAELAQRVEERTRELQQSNLQLQAEVAERKRAESELQQSYGHLQNLFEQTIHGLASALEILDPYTAGHQRRVAAIAAKIADEIHLSEERRRGLYMAASVHDIGKISIPAQILSKPGRLLPEEFALIKTHSVAGYNVLDRIEFPWPVADIVAQHHEQCDGSGYPHGLTADDILLESKILTVADVFEAMTAHRPYRPSLGTDKAIQTIKEKRGRGFDEEVVDAFMKLFHEGSLEIPEA